MLAPFLLRKLAPILFGLILGLSIISARAGGPVTSGPSAGTQAIDPDDQHYWNDKFSDPRVQFNRNPSRLLVETVRDLKPGLALDLGMGEGRNSIYLAQQGWLVTGVDLSNVAVEQARRRSAKMGVKLDATVDGLDHFDFGQNRWDLIILFYVHAWYNDARPQSAQRLREALKPGGILIIEGFAGDESYTFKPNELLHDFSDLKVLRYEDTQGDADWAPARRSHIIRLVAQKVM